MHVDMDSFDYGFYAYGLSLYGDMPLIEELEYKEEARIEDLAIVLDTSGSCAGDLLQSFLNTTVKILSESESFFQNLNLHVIQCDNEIQSDTVIHSLEEAQELLSDFKAKGFGGTDFRPAFRYIENLKETGELKNLRGMIYFTDGYGTYPVSRPPFKTAFVLKGDFDPDVKVPGWAIRMNIDEDELA
jgi:predicted metal-dependent peptidase